MKLYRYRKANLEHLKSEIINDEFFLWSLNDQNDPFEGRLLYNNNLNQESLFRALANARRILQTQQFKRKDWLATEEDIEYLERLKRSSDMELAQMAHRSISNGEYDQNRIGLIKSLYQKMTDNLVMSCFSLKKNNHVMFAHYGDNHRGICLEYNVDVRDFFKVEYVEEFPKLDIFNPRDELIMKYRACTKHKDWEYEQEYRLILYNRPPGLYSNERIQLQSIYLGLNSSEETKNGIFDFVSTRKKSLNLYSLTMEDDNYELNCRQIL